MDITDKLDLMLFESYMLPISVGDVVFGGRFKNKRIKIQTIEFNEKGDLLINGKGAMKIRIPKAAGKKTAADPEDEKGEGVAEPEEKSTIVHTAVY